MSKGLIASCLGMVALAIILPACDEAKPPPRVMPVLEDRPITLGIICLEGVQYLYSPTGNSSLLTVRMNTDGKPYLCSRLPVKYKEVPVG